MKKFIGLVLLIIFPVFILCLFNNQNVAKDGDSAYLRVHIRANSNDVKDQSIKHEIKAAVVDYLTPKLTDGSTFKEAYSVLNANLKNIEKVANDVLENNGFNYKAQAILKEEYFPTRSYGDYTLENGYYDALIVNLGTGKGDNWWCVVYPPLCFIGAEGNVSKNIKYKSKLVEIIQNFFK